MPQDRVDEPPVPRTGQGDGLGHRGMSRDPAEQELIGTEPEQRQRLGVDVVERPVRRQAQGGVDGDQPPDRPVGQVRSEGPVPAGEPRPVELRRDDEVRIGRSFDHPADRGEGRRPGPPTRRGSRPAPAGIHGRTPLRTSFFAPPGPPLPGPRPHRPPPVRPIHSGQLRCPA